MDRVAYNAMLAQYATPEVSGDGRVSWAGGVRCVMPEVKLYGKCEQDGTPTPDAPIPIKCNNGLFVARGSNLVDTNAYQLNTYFYGGGVNQVIGIDSKQGYAVVRIDILPATNYTIALNNTDIWLDRMAEMDSADLCTANWAWYGWGDPGPIVTITTNAATKYAWLRLCKRDGTSITLDDLLAIRLQVVEGSYTADTMPPYTPYYNGGQATAPELYAIPGTEYRDEWDAQTGRGIRRVKKLVFDGTERWKHSKQNEYKICIYVSMYQPPLDASYGNAICSHLNHIHYVYATNITSGVANITGIALSKNTGILYMSLPLSLLDTPDLDGAKSYLAKQYKNGTPVTFFATQDNEPFYHPPARLTQPNGTGQIIQVSGSVPDCPIEASYLTHS